MYHCDHLHNFLLTIITLLWAFALRDQEIFCYYFFWLKSYKAILTITIATVMAVTKNLVFSFNIFVIHNHNNILYSYTTHFLVEVPSFGVFPFHVCQIHTTTFPKGNLFLYSYSFEGILRKMEFLFFVISQKKILLFSPARKLMFPRSFFVVCYISSFFAIHFAIHCMLY